MKLLLYGMVGWLGLLTVVSVVSFTIMYVRLDRTYHALQEADVCSVTTGSRRSSVLDWFKSNDGKRTSLTFYDSDYDAAQNAVDVAQNSGSIGIPTTDHKSECENGSTPKSVVIYRSAAVHHLNSVTASDSQC